MELNIKKVSGNCFTVTRKANEVQTISQPFNIKNDGDWILFTNKQGETQAELPRAKYTDITIGNEKAPFASAEECVEKLAAIINFGGGDGNPTPPEPPEPPEPEVDFIKLEPNSLTFPRSGVTQNTQEVTVTSNVDWKTVTSLYNKNPQVIPPPPQPPMPPNIINETGTSGETIVEVISHGSNNHGEDLYATIDFVRASDEKVLATLDITKLGT